MKTVVTGVAGFIGSHIAERLIADGHEVIGIDDLSAGYLENIPKGVKFMPADICKPERYSFFLDGVDVVFNNAASKKNICLKNPQRDMEVNGIGTLTLIEQCVKHGVRKFVHASTGSVYGEVQGRITEETAKRPVSYYGISKTAGESYVMLHSDKINVTVLRYFHVYGARQEKNMDTGGVIAIFTDRIKRNQGIMIHGDGSQKRVFTYVKDIVEANIKAWLTPISEGKIYNCASMKTTTIFDMAVMIINRFGNKININYSNPLPGDIYNFDVDSSKIGELGVVFRPIDEVYENPDSSICL